MYTRKIVIITPYNNVTGELKGQISVRNISDKIAKAICYVYKKKLYDSNFESDLCSYMYYWIGHKIYDNSGSTPVFTRIMRMLFQVLNGENNIMICNPLSYTIDRDTFYKNKLLFDYSQDHENIKIHTAGYKTCNKDYKEYIDKYIRVYKDEHSDCYGRNENKYDCKTFFSLFPKDKYNELSSFHCVPSENPIAISERPSVYGTEEHAQNEHFEGAAEVQDSVNHRSTAVDFNRDRKPSSVFPQDPEKIQSIPIEDSAEGGSSKAIAGSIAPVLGVSSFSLLLYKVIENIIGIHQIIGYI
ncbi:hypothetical protein PVMG_06061 [Plasmodium vivax Mauritania I]|uniref:Variable surface protein Vir7-like protein n=1 Tax=Plasmodium vivax Mauritania I TaxID=1035515 RepID=A0A0J9VQZ7_PLAVI|nr:hypothetical protein PVMG_06061 [Plasmodium vivax Mauritania I]